MWKVLISLHQIAELEKIAETAALQNLASNVLPLVEAHCFTFSTMFELRFFGSLHCLIHLFVILTEDVESSILDHKLRPEQRIKLRLKQIKTWLGK